ncbi:hypothetical protein NDU88_000249 [Pleurodeles waltl]|uniref:Uncharacterized protein n=1 Tax=Pleurodeles waltl TaxID=8319 RepID=A0AAV7L9D6_PLEWA|nr:hypothetical protein NDU88_000249 [Pleurodeles waltl]
MVHLLASVACPGHSRNALVSARGARLDLRSPQPGVGGCSRGYIGPRLQVESLADEAQSFLTSKARPGAGQR